MKKHPKRLGTVEKWSAALGLVFVIAGADMIVRPTDGIVFHPSFRYFGGSGGPYPPEHVSKGKCRVYGGISVVLGAGIIWAARRG